MSFRYVNGVTFANMTDFLENASDGVHKALTDMGWTLHYTISATSGSTDKVFKSTGEDGTEVIWIRITQVGNLVILRIGTYYPTSGMTYNVASTVSNEVGTSTSGWSCFEAAATPFIGWISGNKDHVAICFKQDGYYSVYGMGTIKRISPEHWSGRCTLNGAHTVNSGAGQVLNVNETPNNITAGQKLFIVNVGDTNKGTLLQVTVTAVDTGLKTITVTNSTSATSFDTGALVAFDPMPTCIIGNGLSMGGYYRGAPMRGSMFLYSQANTRFTGAAQSTPVINAGTLFLGNPYVYYSSGSATAQKDYLSPSASGAYGVQPWLLHGHHNSSWTLIGGSQQLRGYLERICSLTYGTAISPEDTLKDGSKFWIALRDEAGNQYLSTWAKLVAIRTVN